MEHWEFLLQKDGDRSWLPLDSRAEILEGRYRIVVRSSQPNTDVAIHISHLATAATPPKRRVQKRSSRTNSDGLMVLIPYTRLEPGTWGFHCGPGDLMSELVKPWQQVVQLEVLAQEAEAEDWEPDWSEGASDEVSSPRSPASPEPAIVEQPAPSIPVSLEPVSLETLSGESDLVAPTPVSERLQEKPTEVFEPATTPSSDPAIAAPQATFVSPENSESSPRGSESASSTAAEELWQLTEQLSDELINEVMQELDLMDLPEPWVRSPSFSNLSRSTEQSEAPAPPPSPFSLKLDQVSFVVYQAETLTLTGVVSGQPQDRSVVPEIPDPWDSTGNSLSSRLQPRSLWLYLRDPQSLEVLVSQHQPLTEATPGFSLTFSLPDHLTTRLLLGEVQLCGFSEASRTLQVLATQTFTITVNPIELVQELTRLNNGPELEGGVGAQALQNSALSLDLSFLAPEREPKPIAQSYSLHGQPLPPQLYQPEVSSRDQSLHLPDFAAAPKETLPKVTSENEELIGPSATSEATEATEGPAIASGSSPIVEESPETDLKEDATEVADLGVSDLEVSDPVIESLTADARETTEAPDEAIEETSLDHAAFRALNLHSRFLSRLSALVIEGGSGQVYPVSGNGLTWSSPASLSEVAECLAEEEVVAADAPSLTRNRRIDPKASTVWAQVTELPNPLVLSADEPVPTPDLHVTTGELVAGKPVNVRVRLPSLLPRLYVKLWISDRQTRSLLEGPRWLMDLLPNGHDALEATTQLMVPLGSLDVQFEAIAVEVQTQRESRKVTVDRAVVPPNLPTLSLSDFEV
ncbi:MAG TPA: hypothetical protein V6D18_21015 [Thermosynechococcaceae cyanobacterium]